MSTFTDWRGTEIKKGSIILYAVGSSSSVNIAEAEVVDITPTDNYHVRAAKELEVWLQKNPFDQRHYDNMVLHKNLCYKLRVRRIAQPFGFSSWENPERLSTLTSVERVTVIG